MKITKRQLRRIIKEEKTRLQEIFDDESFDAWAAAARGNVNVEDEYVKLIKELGPRSFVTRLIRAFGDMSGHSGGHESIIRYIKENS